MTDSPPIVCIECDLLIKLPHLDEGKKAVCPRCGYTLMACHRNAKDRVIAYSFTALFFLILSFMFPFLTYSNQGGSRTVTLLQSINVMVAENFTSLAILIYIFILIIPVAYLLSSIYVYTSLKSPHLFLGTRKVVMFIEQLQHWRMGDIFLISVLVSFTKIATIAELSFDLSFWAYVLYVLSITAAVLHTDKCQVMNWLEARKEDKSSSLALEKKCPKCNKRVNKDKNFCDSCGATLHKSSVYSVQVTWALLLTSVLLYIPANTLPIMQTTYLGAEINSTIVGGVLALWAQGSYPIAIIIFIASVLVPVGKLMALATLCLSTQTRNHHSYKQKTLIYRMTELIGRWSMLDVFVVMVLAALIKQGSLINVHPGWAAVAFAGTVIFSMLATLSFEPRLIWAPFIEKKY